MKKPKTREQLIAAGYKERYGAWMPPLLDQRTGRPVVLRDGTIIQAPDWFIELSILRGHVKVPDYRGDFYHFKKYVTEIWGDENETEGYFQWNPNAEKIVEKAMEHKWLAVAGCASSGKTETLALFAVAKYLIFPAETKVLVTSMTVASAEGKVWGSLLKYWNRAERRMTATFPGVVMPGKLVQSKHTIFRRTEDGKLSRKEGIELVPAEASEFKKSAEKLQGYKAKYLVVCGDEWATLAQGVLETCKENLSNNEKFQLLASFNPDSHFDPGGILAEPWDGWSSIDINTDEWRTKLGYCVRFDGLKSPNVIAGRNIYKGIFTSTELANRRAEYSGNEAAPGFCRMVRGYWSPTGTKESIFSDAEMETYRVMRRHEKWLEPGVMIAGLDPSFTHGGDRAVLTIGRVGNVVGDGGGQIRVCERVATYVLDDAINKGRDKNEQIVEMVAELLKKHNVKTENLGVDISGAAAFGTLLAQKIGTGFIAINFGGSPTDMRVSRTDKRTGKEAYVNRASELWFGIKPLIRSGQISGLDADTIIELCARSYTDRGGRVEIETKERMKQRTKRSPDRGDSYGICLDVARLKHGLTAMERPPVKNTKTTTATNIFGQFYNLEELAVKPTRNRIHVPDLQEAHPWIGGGGWGDTQ